MQNPSDLASEKPTHQTISAAKISLLLSVFILGLKFGAYALTHSQAVLSDATESIVNVLTAIVALIVMRIVAQPADEKHPYGHGKLEYFSSAFEGGMIAFAALVIGVEAIKSLINKNEIHELESGMLVMAGAALVNLLLGLYLQKVGKKHQSEAIKASGAHVLSDVWTTVGILLGLLLVKITGWIWLDPLMALAVAVLLSVSGYKIVRQAAGGLIDEIDKNSLKTLCEALNLNRRPGLIDVHNLRIIRAGRFHHVDAHLVVPDFWDALKVHEESHDFEQKVVATYVFDGEFAFHVDPCRRDFCDICDLEACPIRRKPFSKRLVMSVDSIIQGPKREHYE